MPVEIRELVIQARVSEDQGSAQGRPTTDHATTLALKNLKEDLRSEVLNLTEDLFKEQKER